MRHTIADIRFGGEPWLTCSCGHAIAEPTPAALSAAWTRHRESVKAGKAYFRGDPVHANHTDREAWL